MAEKILLEASDVSKHFGGVQACEGVSIRVQEGAIHAVIGPNGAGKTTFFNALSGFYFPDRGRVLFRGEEITRMPNWRRIELRDEPHVPNAEHLPRADGAREPFARRAQPPGARVSRAASLGRAAQRCSKRASTSCSDS